MKKFLELFILLLILGASPQRVIKDFHLLGFDKNGNRNYELWAQRAEIFEKKVKMHKITANLYGEKTVFIKAEKAFLDEDAQNLKLEKNVNITSEDKLLLTQSLDWDIKENKAKTSSEVEIKEPEFTIKATGLEADLNNKKTILKNKVSLSFKKRVFTSVSCQGPMEIDYKNNIAILYNKVKVDDTEGQIFSDKMEVYFDPESKKIKKIRALGNVKIVRKDSVTYAKEAEFDVNSKKLTLKGNPRLLIISER